MKDWKRPSGPVITVLVLIGARYHNRLAARTAIPDDSG